MSDRIAVMDRGRVLQVGTPTEIYRDPADRFVMEFMGSPNAFAGRVERMRDGGADVAVPGAPTGRARHAGSALATGAGVTGLWRPESVHLSAGPPAAPAAPLC